MQASATSERAPAVFRPAVTTLRPVRRGCLPPPIDRAADASDVEKTQRNRLLSVTMTPTTNLLLMWTLHVPGISLLFNRNNK